MKKRYVKKRLAAAALALATGGAALAGNPTKVSLVIDGNTIRIEVGEGWHPALRSRWIAAPDRVPSLERTEAAQMCGDPDEKTLHEMGVLATKYAKSMMPKGTPIKADIKGNYRDGRQYATITLPDGTIYGEDAIRDGYACIYRVDNYPAQLEQVLQEARDANRGLWATHPQMMGCLCDQYNHSPAGK